jgi:LuxR family maltose regulon positive regulatory protein
MAETPPATSPASDRSKQALLLITKLYIPRASPNLVPRPRLVERMNEGMQRKLTLVSAPAGFGKTTLIAEWLKGRMPAPRSQGGLAGRPGETGDSRLEGNEYSQSAISNYESPKVGWVSLDEGDNDPARFWTYFIAALETLHAGIGEGALDFLQSSSRPPIETVLTTLMNTVATLPDDFALVLDDYHVIESQSIHGAITFLLDHLPPQMHLVIACRSDPPLPLARLRGRGQLVELRAADLRFTPDEAATFLNQVMGLNLTAQHIAALEARTEGWIAGLQLAALSMQGREDISRFIAAFTGSQHYILDYLMEEVLQRQTESIQAFLLQTSILERMTGPLCDAVLGTNGSTSQPVADSSTRSLADSRAVLDFLEHANLFVVPLDERRKWYRYHRLFADFLRARLHQAWPDRVPKLHHRASAWYEHNGHMTEAIDHALSAEDFERAAHLIEQAAEPILMRSEVATFLCWVEALPGEVVRARPRLYVYYAGLQLMGSRPLEAAETSLREAMQADTADAVSGEVAVFQALIAAYQGKTRQSAESAQRALELLPEDSLFLRSLVAGILGINYLYGGDIAAATHALDEAVRISQQAGNLMNTVLALCHLAEISMIQGRLQESKAIYDHALELAVDRQGRAQPIAGIAHIGLGNLFREWGDLESAARHFTQGIELAQKWGEAGVITGYSGLARVKQAQGDVNGACAMIQMAQQLAIKFDAMEMDDMIVGVHQVHLWMAQGNLEAAARWVEERGFGKGVGSGELEEGRINTCSLLAAIEYITLAEVYIAQGRPGDALVLCQLLLRVTETAGWTALAIEILALQAIAYQMQDDTNRAMATLERALALAEPGGFVRVFLGLDDPMAQLLRQAAGRGIAPDYVRRLLAALGAETKDQGQRTAGEELSSVASPSSLIEPLSERELEVLELIAAGCSNREIAEELVVAVSTVKSHINNIYRKLDVSSRTQAVARARGLNLV